MSNVYVEVLVVVNIIILTLKVAHFNRMIYYLFGILYKRTTQHIS